MRARPIAGQAGFEFIYTSQVNGRPTLLLPPNCPTPHKSPYIIFAAPQNKETQALLVQLGFLRLGTLYGNGDKCFLTVTGNRKVIKAIDIFLQQSNIYPKATARALAAYLLEFRQQCIQQIATPRRLTPPRKGKRSSDYETDTNAGTPDKTANQTSFVRKRDKPHKQYVRKENPTGRSISDIEAFNGFCYRVMLGNRHPKVFPLYDDEGDRAGVLSKKIPGYTSFHKLKDTQPLNADYLFETEVIRIWVASYVEEENDLHTGNYGVIKDKTSPLHDSAVKLDDDQSTYSLSSKGAFIDPRIGLANTDTPPLHAFPVTARDIRTLPRYTDAKPDKKVTDYFAKEVIDKLLQDAEFQLLKYRMFLKRILIPDNLYHAFAKATMGSAKQQRQFAEHKIARTRLLENVLTTMPEFQYYVLNHPEAIQEICNEFAEYNKDHKRDKDAELRVDLQAVTQKFEQIKQTVKVQKYQPVKAAVTDTKESYFAKNYDNLTGIFSTWTIAGALIGAAFGGIGIIAGIVAGAMVGAAIAGVCALANAGRETPTASKQISSSTRILMGSDPRLQTCRGQTPDSRLAGVRPQTSDLRPVAKSGSEFASKQKRSALLQHSLSGLPKSSADRSRTAFMTSHPKLQS